MIDIRERLHQLRSALQLTTREFGESIGVSASAISNVETGYRNVTDKHIKLICAAFPQVNENWLRTGEGEMFIATESTTLDKLCVENNFGQIERSILEEYIKLPDDQREIMRKYITNIAARFMLGDSPAQPESVPVAPPPDPAAELEARINAKTAEYKRQLLLEEQVKGKSSEWSAGNADSAG